MSKKFRTPWNMPGLISPGEKNGMPSLTMPGQDISVKDLIARYATGRPLTNGREADFDEEPEQGEFIPGWSKMDRVERIDAMRAAEAELNDLKSKLDAKAARSKKKAELKQLEAEFEKKQQKKEEKPGQAIPAADQGKGGTTV